MPGIRHRVIAVLVSHDGAAWLPSTLTTLAGQTRPPDVVVGVDTGSSDNSRELLTAALGEDRVVEVSERTGFGPAVRAGVTRADALITAATDYGMVEPRAEITTDISAEIDAMFDAEFQDHGVVDESVPDEVIDWLWFLHDDSAPNPECLERLINVADADPSFGVLGPKVLGWHDRRLLLEVGVTVSSTGRRETGIEPHEHDQGQHDLVSEVLSVGSAGMLVRRDLWNQLGGFDPAINLFREDLDLCIRAHRSGSNVRVVPDAVIHHREAATHGRRNRAPGTHRPRAADRQSALYVLLAHTPAWRLPLTVLRLMVVTLFGALGDVLAKDPGDALDSLAALFRVLVRPRRVFVARRRISRTAILPYSALRHLRPSFGVSIRRGLEALAGSIAASPDDTVDVDTSAAQLETGPVEEEALSLERGGPGIVRRSLVRPGVAMVVSLAIVAAVAARDLWFGAGQLVGGALYPAPEAASSLWHSYLDAWHSVGPGSSTPAPPYLAAVAALGFVLLGKASWAVTLILLLGVPLAGWSLYASLNGILMGRAVRMWVAIAYAFLPAIAGAAATGRMGTMAIAILLPPTIRLLARCTGSTRALPRATARTPWLAALLLALTAMWAPAIWLILASVGVLAIVWPVRGWRYRVNTAVALVVPMAMLLPWSWWVITNPSLLFVEAGASIPVVTPAGPAAWIIELAMGNPGGPGSGPPWIVAGLVLAGAAALLRSDTRRTVVGVWIVGTAALVVGIVMALTPITPPGSVSSFTPWPGPAMLVFGMAMIVAAGVGVEGLRARAGGESFGWRQPVTLLVTAIACVTPVLAGTLWVIRGFDGPLHRGAVSTLPAFVAAESAGDARPRTLVLQSASNGVMSYALVSGSGPQLGDADMPAPAASWAPLDELVGRLVAGVGGSEVDDLAGYAIRYIQLAEASSPSLLPVLDSEPGLRRVSNAGGGALWRVSAVTSLARITTVGPDGEPAVTAVPVATGTSVDPLATGVQGPGTLALAVAPDPHWQVLVSGRAVPPTSSLDPAAWPMTFDVPADTATVSYDGSTRSTWLWLQLGVLVLVVILALPGRKPDEDTDADGAADEALEGRNG